MADEKEIEGQATETETEEKATGTDQNKTEKTFSQDEVNRLIAKEKASWKRGAEKQTADHETIVDGLRKDVEARDEVIKKTLDLLKKDLGIDEAEWEADFGDRDVLWQYNRLLEKTTKAGKKQIPRTPRGEGKEIPANPFKTNQVV
jgi:hypothetical protein